ncbi:MAG: alpha/beta hydrolase [Chloroflexi bacterium]|nr:alpha/beta hydrolase [Chloroflexota bacterium]
MCLAARQSELTFIHRWLPAQSPTPPETLLLLHGTGANENDLLPLGRALSPQAALLSPRGQVLEHGIPRFFRRFAEGVFDVKDLESRAHELADFVVGASQVYGFDRKRIVAVGFSNGANIAAGVLLLRPELLAGAVLIRAMVPLVPDPLPRLDGVQIFLAAGTQDPIVRPEETERLAALLGAVGADVTLHWEQSGHTIMQSEVEVARTWLERARASRWENGS